ncbi:hypothetical protein PSACC_00289 [Paramicrosporidium saccamoebae]|uniref:N-acetyltransferase ESCO acetyl-transferase domain-containing protein n=1 Tax=Paramicrosporidium saccamoebae TaxID=1246581 RepID=A0A2H9TQ73_9FUNG|nr:hypothetical protein PSACC_00289 [Paramicrosporidium saccamoebae]
MEKSIWKDEHSNGDVIAVVLGSSHCKELIDRVNILMEAVEQSIEDVQALRVYLFVCNNKVSGMMTTERLSNATRVNGEKQNCSVSVGVSRIWVSPTLRRKGVALRLLRAIRKCNHQYSVQCTTDCTVDPRQVAFSQPTSQGKSLAIKFLDYNGDYIFY